jgi:FKBP-type peptidyl-prolyl cis-trans isomerase FklB
MKLRWMAVFGVGLVAAQLSAQEPAGLKTQKERTSYALGMDLANSLKKQSIDVDPALFSQGLRDVLGSSKTLLTEEEVRTILAALQTEVRNNVMAKIKQDGAAFLAQNKAKDGVVTLPSGLQYKILKAGDGKKPGLDDTVVCHYKGTLIDGTEFDSSYKRNQPATFPVKGVIKGWTEALQLMPVGSQWQLVIPSDLAYGDRGAANVIPPYSTLVFEVELVSIQAKP